MHSCCNYTCGLCYPLLFQEIGAPLMGESSVLDSWVNQSAMMMGSYDFLLFKCKVISVESYGYI